MDYKHSDTTELIIQAFYKVGSLGIPVVRALSKGPHLGVGGVRSTPPTPNVKSLTAIHIKPQKFMTISENLRPHRGIDERI